MWRDFPARFAISMVALSLLGLDARAEPPGENSQLDRIERKLDEILRRLGPENSGAPQTVDRGKTSAANNAANYRPGALAIARPAPASVRALSEVPADSLGGFTYLGGPIPLYDLSSRGIRSPGLVGLELQGWLKVKEAGRLQLAADLHGSLAFSVIAPPDCLLEIWLEDHLIGPERANLVPDRNRDARSQMMLGVELDPGLYKIRIWVACTAPLNANAVRPTLDFLIKPPGELNLRGVTSEDLMHRSE